MTPTLVFVLILGAAIGLAMIGLALYMIRTEKEKAQKSTESAKTPAQADSAPAPASPAAPTPTLALSEAEGPPHTHAKRPTSQFDPPMLELARLLRAPDGTLVVEADGKRYSHRFDIADANVGRRLLGALDEFQKFLRTDQPRPASPFAASAASPSLTPTPPHPHTAPRPPAIQDAAQRPLIKPSMNPLEQIRILREMEKQPEIKAKPFLEEIDELIQEKVAATPLAGRGLKVAASSTGLAVFWIDGHAYEGIDQLPDAAVRAFVQEVIREWEKR